MVTLKGIWEVIKKYWKIIVGTIAAAILYVFYQKKVTPSNKPDIQEIEDLGKENVTIANDITVVEKKKEELKKDVATTEEQIKNIENQIENIKVPNKKTSEKAEYLKSKSKKKPNG